MVNSVRAEGGSDLFITISLAQRTVLDCALYMFLDTQMNNNMFVCTGPEMQRYSSAA